MSCFGSRFHSLDPRRRFVFTLDFRQKGRAEAPPESAGPELPSLFQQVDFTDFAPGERNA
jgi:hypothetical protein